MVDFAKHKWGPSETKEAIKKAWAEYCTQCYGNLPLGETQLKETRQAFLSGIAWAITHDDYDALTVIFVLFKLLDEAEKKG